ncbi:MAG: hypothetical protein KDK34_23090, partial [Leptospiraceae bacterium]|nr:hypothetical protein [Leptospiraceae bacterium]
WFWAIGYAAFCVFVEVLLNMGGHLVWAYEYWNRSWKGIWLIFLFGYFHFYVAIIIVLSMKSRRNQVLTIAGLFVTAIVMNAIAMGILGWQY